jgi:hypothetical protein
MRTFTAALLVAGALAFGVRAQEPVPREPTLPKTTVGSELYCSNCHGLDAKGRPATPATHEAAPDLTILAMNNGGVFPREAVRDVITGGGSRHGAHGTPDMPVWGTIFRAFEPNDAMVAARVDALVHHLETIQVSSVGTRNSH